MEYREAYEYMINAARTGIRPGLSRIRELARRLSDPQDSLSIIHVAGTNGKGSVCAFLESILRESGYTVSRYISPSLFDYRERFQYNGRYITEDEFTRIVSYVKGAADGMEDAPTAFELETAAAFLFAKETRSDVMVLETGMGGLYDATNIIKSPMAEVFVSIGMDHMQYLGDDIRLIAAEKAGIIKEDVPVVSACQTKVVTEILGAEAVKRHAEIRMVKEAGLSGILSFDRETWTQTFSYKGTLYRSGLSGTYQLMNAAVAVETAELLNGKGILKITAEAIGKGLENARWPGRFDRIAKDPEVIADGAHNPHGAAALRDTVRELMPLRRIIPVMGAFKDKDTDGILSEMQGISDEILVYTAPGERGLKSGALKEQALKWFPEAEAFDTVEEALGAALKRASGDPDASVLVFGTLSTVKDSVRFLKEAGL